MGRKEYQHVIERFCENAGIADVADILHRGMLTIDAHAFSLQYLEATDHCRICVDLGAPLPGNEEALFRMMLESNFADESHSLPVLGLHPDSGHVVLKMHFPVARFTGDVDLYQLITSQMDGLVAAWQDMLDQVGAPTQLPNPGGPTSFA